MAASIIIPVKNEEKNLSRLVPALISQHPLEVIVAIAPSTTDRSKEIVAGHGPLARWVDGGMPSRGRNAGASVARGEYLFFLDADVLPGTEDFIAKAVIEMERKGLGFATVDNYATSPRKRDRTYHQIVNMVFRTGPKLKKQYACGTCIIARKDLHDVIGGFDEKIAFAEDTEYVQRGASVGRFGVLSHDLFVYVDPRRLRKDGVRRTLYTGYKANRYRRKVGEITDIGQISKDYFTHSD